MSKKEINKIDQLVDNSWKLHAEAANELQKLIREYINSLFKSGDQYQAIDDIANNNLSFPDYIVDLAKAALCLAQAGASCDEARVAKSNNG